MPSSFRDGELVDQGPAHRGQRRTRRPGPASAATPPEGISLLMEWWTIHHRGALQTLARDARRSHRSVEGDDLFKRVCVTDIPRGNPLYNIREFEFRAISGLGRIGGGGGLVSDFEHHHHVARSCQLARYPRTTPPPPTISTASLPVLARRFLADPHEIGRIEGIGPDLWKFGAASTRASGGREPVTPEDCGSDCGSGVSNWARTLHLQGSSPPDIHHKPDSGSFC